MKIKETIIVEGKYDKIRLSSIVEGNIVTTTGFDVFKNDETKAYIKALAESTGIVILTDSDYAGFKIRNFIKSFVDEKYIKNAYIPEVSGKEKRKNKQSAEGLLGVEGIDNDTIIKALKEAGCELDGKAEGATHSITRMDLYNDGFLGGEGSADMRKRLCKFLNLPSKMSVNSLINALNSLSNVEKYNEFVEIEKTKEI